jgi:hypothetical protein
MACVRRQVLLIIFCISCLMTNAAGVAITIDLPCALSDMPVARVAVYERIAQAYYVLPFIPNLLCTALIIGKFAAHTRVLRNANLRNANNSYWLLTSCIAESGIVYSAAGIVHCVLWWRQAELYVVTQAIYLASAVSGTPLRATISLSDGCSPTVSVRGAHHPSSSSRGGNKSGPGDDNRAFAAHHLRQIYARRLVNLGGYVLIADTFSSDMQK